MKAHEKCKEMARHAFQLQLQPPLIPLFPAYTAPLPSLAHAKQARRTLASFRVHGNV